MRTKNVTYALGNGDTVGMVRMYADEGKMLTRDGYAFFGCADDANVDGWYEVDAAEAEAIMAKYEEISAEEAMSIITGGATDEA